jgi:rubredoxin
MATRPVTTTATPDAPDGSARYNRRMGKHPPKSHPIAKRPPVQPQHGDTVPSGPVSPAAHAPMYWECPVCGFLSGNLTLADIASICPSCGATGVKRRTFPNDRLRRLDERIRRYFAEGEPEIVVILGAAFLEAILEDILDRIMAAHGADVAIRRTLMDAQRAIGGRIGHVFPELTGVEFEDIAEELGFRDFPKRWRTLRSQRNDFIHDSPFNGDVPEIGNVTAAEAMLLMDQSYKLFVLVNNRFVADGIKSRDAGGT